MQAAKKGNHAFLIYIFPLLDVEPHPHEMPFQYQEFKDVPKKKKCKHLAQALTI
jgi:hypothetical protein